MPAAAKPPSAWQRVITGIIGVPLAGFGLFLIAIGAYFWAAECGGSDDGGFAAAAGALNARPAATDDLPCYLFPLLIVAFGGVLALVGLPFAIATFVPFGRFRRIMVGLGAAIAAGLAIFILVGVQSESIQGAAVVVALPAAAGFFYLGYRIAR